MKKTIDLTNWFLTFAHHLFFTILFLYYYFFSLKIVKTLENIETLVNRNFPNFIFDLVKTYIFDLKVRSLNLLSHISQLKHAFNKKLEV